MAALTTVTWFLVPKHLVMMSVMPAAWQTARTAEPAITPVVYRALGVESSIASRTSFGGTAPKNVRAQAKKWLKTLGRERN